MGANVQIRVYVAPRDECESALTSRGARHDTPGAAVESTTENRRSKAALPGATTRRARITEVVGPLGRAR